VGSAVLVRGPLTDAIAHEYRDAIQALLPPWGRRFVKQAGPNAAMTAWSAGAASKS